MSLSAPVRDEMEQTHWLVECPKYHPGEYFALCECGCGRHYWTKDVHKAAKFPTKEAAEAGRGGDHNCVAVEHLFGLSLPTLTASQVEAGEVGRLSLAMNDAIHWLARNDVDEADRILRAALAQSHGKEGGE